MTPTYIPDPNEPPEPEMSDETLAAILQAVVDTVPVKCPCEVVKHIPSCEHNNDE